KLVAERFGFLLHDAEAELAEPSDHRHIRTVCHDRRAVAAIGEAQLVLGRDGAEPTALLAARDRCGEVRRLLLRDLDLDLERRLGRADADFYRRAIGGRAEDLDALTTGDTHADLIGIGNELPNLIDGRRHREAFLDFHETRTRPSACFRP